MAAWIRSSSWPAPGMPLFASWSKVLLQAGPSSGAATASHAPAGRLVEQLGLAAQRRRPDSVTAATSTLALSSVTESAAAIG